MLEHKSAECFLWYFMCLTGLKLHLMKHHNANAAIAIDCWKRPKQSFNERRKKKTTSQTHYHSIQSARTHYSHVNVNVENKNSFGNC